MFGLDITMCFGKECPLKHNCIRYVAKPERFQSYFAEIPYANGECDCFRDYKNYDSKWIKEEFINN